MVLDEKSAEKLYKQLCLIESNKDLDLQDFF